MKPQTLAIYFPSWHPDEHYEQWYGKDFSEWELLKTTKPLYDGHKQPLKPSWGYFNEAEIPWMEKQIDLATTHGIDGFIFDWYWYQGEKFLNAPLEGGFLNSPSNEKMKFAIMWANHHWGRWPALDDTNLGMNGKENQTATIFLHQKHTVIDFENVMHYCCQNYFCRPNYWKIDGKPVFSIYDLKIMISELGSEEAVSAAMQSMRGIVVSYGYSDLYLLANIGCCNDNMYCCGYDRTGWAENLGFDAVFAYNIVRSKNYDKIADSKPVYDYSEVIESHEFCWHMIERGKVEHLPIVTTGLDVSPRWSRQIKFPMKFKELGYEPIVINNTPEKIAALYKLAMEKAMQKNAPAVIINAWNEWSEGMYLLPDENLKDAVLEAIAKVKKELI